ncbi:ferric reductase like transmembrane component domain-containing protein [Neurospora intermedia]|uniref:ferric-chelate reductase (NADPH) n=1 Tax=Neurospora intermedia TaxID=5142 RepID=A0ABR3DQV4_NEUIN
MTPPSQSQLSARMIQNFTGQSNLEWHWGYAYRVVPCQSDPGSCAYLDVVYSAHDRGMLYTGIFWATILGILLVWGVLRRLGASGGNVSKYEMPLEEEKGALLSGEEVVTKPRSVGRFTRAMRAVGATGRSYLLSSRGVVKPIFGQVTRLQVLILLVLVGYLTIWTFVGIVYSKWITPVKGQPEHVKNTRTSLGPWADRIGVLAYALTPLSILLASRESILSLITGVPYTSFMFLHRWTGHIILVQSILHTIGWVIVEARLYRPHPDVWNAFIAQTYARWGVVALVLLVLLWVGALQWTIRRTGYEFFRKAHYVLAMVYIGAVIGHWKNLQCFLVPGLVLWFVDRGARLVRTALLHYGYIPSQGRVGFAAAQAEMKFWRDEKHGDVVRLDFAHPQRPWKVGQHFFLCFTEGSIWQSHPFTPLSWPVEDGKGAVTHSYILRAKGGETKKLAKIVQDKLAGVPSEKAVTPTTPVILQGPYGESIVEGVTPDVNVLCIAGGTGITYVLPLLIDLLRDRNMNPARKVELVWTMKRSEDVEWVEPEMEELRRLGAVHGLIIRIFVTDDDDDDDSAKGAVSATGCRGESSQEDDDSIKRAPRASAQRASSSTARGRPDVTTVVKDFVEGVAQGSTRVFGSGPPGMIGELRNVVADCNSGSKVWKGEDRFDVRLVCDDRLEW